MFSASLPRAAKRLGLCFRRVDALLYGVWAAVHTLASARMFYGYMLKQTGGEWSAPLDDVFIHFDYARATALGHPFEWTVGNGYSSGNTSLTYPFVLAAGWWLGFTGRALMRWAALIAAVSVFGVLLGSRRLFVSDRHDTWGRISSYALPPIFLGIGALNWSLWSGMEVSFFLATWAVALLAWLGLEQDARIARAPKTVRAHAWWLGLAGALLVTTRPEACAPLAVFGIAAAAAHRRFGWQRVVGILLRAGVPAVFMLSLQAVANRALTGEWSANGAIVKLAINNPYMPADEKIDDFVANATHAVLKNLEYHFAHGDGEYLQEHLPAWWLRWTTPTADPLHPTPPPIATWVGVIPLALGLLPLAFARTRRVAIVLWAHILTWIGIVSLNGQVRWQNERYVMPAVAWLLILATLGLSVSFRAFVQRSSKRRSRPNILWSVLIAAIVIQAVGVITRPGGTDPELQIPWLLAIELGLVAPAILWFRGPRGIVVALALLFAWDHQVPRMRDQKWFFGRASRNIRDQHLTLGAFLRELEPRRVLVGDAGAILYESGRPGLDIIGLGGYHALPFARAGIHGLPATLELLERIPDRDKPDVLAIFPTWWGALPLWFASNEIKRFPVEGNVICGGYEHIVYKADWHALGRGDHLRKMPAGNTRIVMNLDVADLVSEKQHGYSFDRPKNGWTDMHVLPDPDDPREDMFDAGRRIVTQRSERFTARGLTPHMPAHLVVRVAPEKPTRVRVRINGADVGILDLAPSGEWVEVAFPIAPEHVTAEMHFELTNLGKKDFVDFHEWLTQ